MSSFYWIKLYHEVLDDPKMALLPDRLWRRTIELFIQLIPHDGLGKNYARRLGKMGEALRLPLPLQRWVTRDKAYNRELFPEI